MSIDQFVNWLLLLIFPPAFDAFDGGGEQLRPKFLRAWELNSPPLIEKETK